MIHDNTLGVTPQRSARIGNGQRILIYTTCYNILDGVTFTVRKIEQEILSSGGHVRILTTKSGDMNNTNLDGYHPNRDVIFLDNSTVIPLVSAADCSYHFGFTLGASDIASIDEFG